MKQRESVPEKSFIFNPKKEERTDTTKRRLSYGKHSNSKTFRGGGKVI